jgi:glycerophosphoryl diester phosphodiesterase
MKNLSWLKNDLITHRGLYDNYMAPENSKKAFELSIQNDYSIELDVMMLKDGNVICYHDISLLRLTSDQRFISDVTHDQIKDLKLINSLENILLFKDALKLINGQVNLLIEIKPFNDFLTLTKNLMTLLKDYQGNYAIFSFHPKVVYYLKKYHPNVIRGQISEYFSDRKDMTKFQKYLMKTMFFNKFTKPDFISYSISDLPNKYLDKYKKKGLTIISYAAKSQAELDFVKMHYDNAVFENFIPKK